MAELENITEEMAKVMYQYAMQLGCPDDVMRALRRWEEYKKQLIRGE